MKYLFIPPKYGGFHQWGGYPQWMVYNQKSYLEMDDLGVPPSWKPPYVKGLRSGMGPSSTDESSCRKVPLGGIVQ